MQQKVKDYLRNNRNLRALQKPIFCVLTCVLFKELKRKHVYRLFAFEKISSYELPVKNI